MPTENSQELKEYLLRTHEGFRQLTSQHQELDDRLHGLSSKPYLTELEQLQEVTLKKRKLQLKDQMEQILRSHRAESSDTFAPASASPAHRQVTG